MFSRILHAERAARSTAFHALTLALAIAEAERLRAPHGFGRRDRLHAGVRRRGQSKRPEPPPAAFHAVLQRARANGGGGKPREAQDPCPGGASGARRRQACGRSRGGVARHRREQATPRSTRRMVGSRADRIVHLARVPGARCEVTRRRSTLPLPPKSHELNPVEYVWQLKCDGWISNRIFESFAEI